MGGPEPQSLSPAWSGYLIRDYIYKFLPISSENKAYTAIVSTRINNNTFLVTVASH